MAHILLDFHELERLRAKHLGIDDEAWYDTDDEHLPNMKEEKDGALLCIVLRNVCVI